MKYEITQADKDIMARDLQTDRTLKYLNNLTFYKFNIGDVLIREEKHRDYSHPGNFIWKTVTAACGLNCKYVYIYENELGIGYIRRISVNGRKFVDNPMCVTSFDPDQTKFILDPEYADHMLFASENDEFDTKSRYDAIKKKRERIVRLNQKLAIKIDKGEAAAIEWMKKLKPGDQLWFGYGFSGIKKDPVVVKSVQQVSHNWNNFKNTYQLECVDPNNPNGYPSTFQSNNLDSYCFFTTRPHFVDEVID